MVNLWFFNVYNTKNQSNFDKDAEKFSKTTSGDSDEKRRLALAEKYTVDKTSINTSLLYCTAEVWNVIEKK